MLSVIWALGIIATMLLIIVMNVHLWESGHYIWGSIFITFDIIIIYLFLKKLE